MSRARGDETAAEHLTLEPIATVRSCFGSKFAVPRQPGLCESAWGRLTFHDAYRRQEAIRGLEGFSHLWLIFGFHETRDQGWKPTVRPPRLGGNERIGVFASRSTFRPNALGLSLVRLEGIDRTGAESPVLELGGLDLVDGTPVYDIKPYLSYADSRADARSGYADQAPGRLEVVVSAGAQPVFAQLPPRTQALVREVLSLDCRPAVRRGDDARVFGAELAGYNVRFAVANGRCTVVEIQDGQGSGLNG